MNMGIGIVNENRGLATQVIRQDKKKVRLTLCLMSNVGTKIAGKSG